MSTTLEKPVPQSQPVAKPTANSAAELRMEVFENLDRIMPAVTEAWRQMTENPMGSPDWLLPWWEHYATQKDQLQLICFFDQEELVAVIPLYLENGAHFKLLGSGKVCSDHSELFIANDHWRPLVSALFLDWLNGSDAPNWHSLQLEAIDALAMILTQRTKVLVPAVGQWNRTD